MNYEWANKTVLFAEDDEASAIYLAELLKLFGVKVIHVTSGMEAVNIFREQQTVNLVIMDMRLPEMSGFQATRMIKEINPDIPVLAVTACAMLEDRRRCKIAGCDGYLSKPVMPGELLPLIQYFFDRKKSRTPLAF